jgi:hypothetical protein
MCCMLRFFSFPSFALFSAFSAKEANSSTGYSDRLQGYYRSRALTSEPRWHAGHQLEARHWSCSNMVTVDELFRNTRAFRSFQISQDINIAREAIAFLPCACLWISSIHHSLTERRTCHMLGSTSCSQSQFFTIVHTRMVKRHLLRM